MRKEKFEKARLMFERILSFDETNFIAVYNMACCDSLLGNKQQALQTLHKAVQMGYRNFSHLASDPDFNNINQEPQFLELIKKNQPEQQQEQDKETKEKVLQKKKEQSKETHLCEDLDQIIEENFIEFESVALKEKAQKDRQEEEMIEDNLKSFCSEQEQEQGDKIEKLLEENCVEFESMNLRERAQKERQLEEMIEANIQGFYSEQEKDNQQQEPVQSKPGGNQEQQQHQQQQQDNNNDNDNVNNDDDKNNNKKDKELEANLALFYQMGFTNVELLTSLLKQNNHDFSATLSMVLGDN